MTGSPDSAAKERREELDLRLGVVRSRIADACVSAGRRPDEVTLVVVTKYFPASDVRLLAGLGVTDVAENRHQEAVAKQAECADLGLVWHYVGGLQSNKAHQVARWADVVQSVDRERLLPGLARGSGERGAGEREAGERRLPALLQVSLDPPERAQGRSGADPAAVPDLARAVLAESALELRGVMAVAPRGEDPGAAFARLAEVAAGVRAVAPRATWISAGMSNDLEQAIAHGATHVRVGSAVLGNRPPHG